jgi:hypothetical protein
MASSKSTMHWQCNNVSLSARGRGGEGRGEVGASGSDPKLGPPHLTLPGAVAPQYSARLPSRSVHHYGEERTNYVADRN